MDNAPRAADPRATLVERLAYLHALLGYIGEQWQAKAAIGQRYQPSVPLKKTWGVLPILLWSVGLTFALFTVAEPVLDLVYRLVLGPFVSVEWANANTGVMVAVMLAIPVAMSLALAYLIVRAWNRFVLPRQNARIQDANQRREERNEAVRAEEQQVDARLTRAGQDFATHIGTDFFPQAYTYPEAVAFCITMVRNHRANSVTEALNLYETELHRRRVEDGQAAMLAEQKETQRQVRVGTVINAAMTGAAIGTIRAEGRATRAASAANAARVTSQMREPKTVYVKKSSSWW